MVMSPDEYYDLKEAGKTDEEIEEIKRKRESSLKDKLSNLMYFMNSEMYEKLPKAIKRTTQKEYDKIEKELKCTCDGYNDSECYICLQTWRRERYGWDIHNTDCVCNECQPIGYSSW